MLSLQLGELPALRGVVGKLIVGEDSPWNNVRSHVKSSSWMRVAGRGTSLQPKPSRRSPGIEASEQYLYRLSVKFS